MQLRKPLAVAATVSALAIAGAMPAAADDTSTTFELTGGSLVLSVQATAALTDAATGATSIEGDLGVVSVTDERGGSDAWNVSGASTAFTGAIVDGSSSTAVDYTGGTVATTGDVTVADGTTTTLTGETASVVAPSSLSGNNTAEWTPTLAVTMPAGALADTYTGVVTTSIL